MSASLLLLLSLTACKKDKGSPVGDDTSTGTTLPFEGVPLTEEWTIPQLQCDAHVVRTDADVPHVYAHDRLDMARVYGFVQAKDRYFEMDLARRLGRGSLSEILGSDALPNDMDSRASGMTWVGDNLLSNLTEDQAQLIDAFTEGVNAYIAAVKADQLPLPSELEIAGPFLGVSDPKDLMQDWTRADVTGMAAVLVYQLGYETGDVGNAAAQARLPGLFDGAALADLRNAGAVDDIWNQIHPVLDDHSANGWGTDTATASAQRRTHRALPVGKPVPQAMLDRLVARNDRFAHLLGRGDLDAGWGSNVWAVGGGLTSSGNALLSGDGHLPLSVPSLFWQVGLDDSVLGGGDTHQVGLGLPGLPYLAVGTNGKVAWSQTQLMGDITDWYREEIQLGKDGASAASRFQGEWQPLDSATEHHVIAKVPLLGSAGGTYDWTRYTTFDGRWIADIEGVTVTEDYSPAAGESVVVFPDYRVVPGDTDGDGVITAISFDYTAFSDGNMLNAVDRFGHADSVEDFKEATRYLVAYSQNMGVADTSGSVLYTGYQADPCRGYLARNSDGTWADGADPSLLLDGTTYGGFEIPIGTDGLPIEGEADPYQCLVPFDEYPNALDPAQGFIVNANNDPGGFTLDDSLTDEPWYIGGPWVEGFRAHRITELIEQGAADGTLDADWMARIQGDHRSALGAWFTWHLVESIEAGRAAASNGSSSSEADQRLAALYTQDADALDEIESRLQAWAADDYPAENGVQTFYNTPDAQQIDDSIATTLFNTWLGKWGSLVFDDENLGSIWKGGGTTGRVRALTMFLAGRGPDNPEHLASWNPDTQESAFFDILGTDTVETSDEVALMALLQALDFLRSDAGTTDVRGTGFGTADISQYKWGMRHQTRFESVLGDFVGGSSFSFITDQFSISTDVLPLEGEAGTEDLQWFPRPGDNLSVDAANNGWGTDFTHGSGPVFRMVIELGPSGFVSGRNVLPGGQSALIDSPHFADQASLWLANQTVPLWLDVQDVAAHGVSRERFHGGAGSCE